MSKLIPTPRAVPRLNSSALDQNVGARVVTQQLREVFREAFDNLGGVDWLVNFANANDQNARVFVQAISKLLPASAREPSAQVIIDVPWLTRDRLAYKVADQNPMDADITDILPTKE